RLGNLFRLDHLATRMRRNSANLLVLAGHKALQPSSEPIALVDVLRAAVSEIEHYERVSLNVQPGISVRGHVVNDVVHLLAELLETATSCSPAEASVTASGHLLTDGGVLLDITDQGMGMPADEMRDANSRLDNPPVVDVETSRRMGLFVVARLASRNAIKVRLGPGPTRGMTALIWLPNETVTYQASGAPSRSQRFQADPRAAGYPPAGAAAGAASARAPAVAADPVPRFGANSPGTHQGQPESTGELADDGEAALSPGAWATRTTNGPGAAQPAAGGTDQADHHQWDDVDDVRARSDSEAPPGLGPRAGSRAQDSQAEAITPPAMSTAE